MVLCFIDWQIRYLKKKKKIRVPFKVNLVVNIKMMSKSILFNEDHNEAVQRSPENLLEAFEKSSK